MEKKQAAAIKKEAIEKKADPIKQSYRIQLEGIVPVILHYKVMAYSAEEALEIALKSMERMNSPPSIILPRLKRIKAKVFRYGTVAIDFIKNF